VDTRRAPLKDGAAEVQVLYQGEKLFPWVFSIIIVLKKLQILPEKKFQKPYLIAEVL
jgi:hypothetical protein